MSSRLPIVLTAGLALAAGFAGGRFSQPAARPVPWEVDRPPQQVPAPVPGQDLTSEIDGEDLVIRTASSSARYVLLGDGEPPGEGAGPIPDLAAIATVSPAGRGWTVRLPSHQAGRVELGWIDVVAECRPGEPCKPCAAGVCGSIEPPPTVPPGFLAPLSECTFCGQKGCIEPPGLCAQAAAEE
jgi:hypothetical protein